MKYKKIDNILFRMVEPEPLTETATFPCVVRLIQDDSPMGRNNDFYATSHLLAHIEIINGLDAIHFVRWQGSKTHYSRFEIIGYPVADGSAEWALYHVLHKERRALTGYVNDVLVHIQNTEYGIGLYYSGKIMPFDFITPEQFIEGAAHTGWQLYEPQPEPKPEHPAINGYNRYDYIPVEGIRQPKPEHPAINGYNRYDYIPVEGIRQPKPEPEPPREPEYVICKRCAGTQSVPNPVVSNTAYTTCSKCGGTGYEIEPEPAFKAGDWAKYDIDSYLRVIETPGRERALCKTLSGVIVYPYTSCLTKVSPSEVVVHIGCLSGTVRPSYYSNGTLLTDEFILYLDDVKNSIIAKAMLDEPTLTIVNDLLEKQEEEK